LDFQSVGKLKEGGRKIWKDVVGAVLLTLLLRGLAASFLVSSDSYDEASSKLYSSSTRLRRFAFAHNDGSEREWTGSFFQTDVAALDCFILGRRSYGEGSLFHLWAGF
jgi:hypothetical protein